MTRDPICGMIVEETKSRFKSVHNGRTYYFCMKSCKNAFDSDPDRFVIDSKNM